MELTGHALTPDDVVNVARGSEAVTLSAGSREAMQRSADVVARLADSDEPAYGVSTGFGSLATVRIPARAPRGAAAGADPLARRRRWGRRCEREVVRAMMLLRARYAGDGLLGRAPGGRRDDPRAAQRRHHAGRARARIARRQRRPRAAGALRAGAARRGGGRLSPTAARRAAEALAPAGIEPLELTAKEGLALINGTDGMLGMLVLALHDLRMLLKAADITAAMSVEALLGTDRAFAAGPGRAAPPARPGATAPPTCARCCADSAIVASHRYGDPRVQDAYSLRCAPQVTGAARDALAHARAVADGELRSAIDNPMVLPDGRVESCGNFHGAPVGLRLRLPGDRRRRGRRDRRAAHRPAARRRRARTACRRSSRRTPGVNSGLMIAQYTQAAMVAENRRLAAPASVDSLPTSAMQEDHVSMGWGAARKLRTAVANLGGSWRSSSCAAARGDSTCARRCARRPATGGGARRAARARSRAPGPTASSSPELAAAEAARASGALVAAVEAVDRERWHERRAARPVRAPRGTEHQLPRLAAGGRDADADEQPRPGRRRAPRRARRLRRHRPRGALVGGVRRDRRAR